MRPLSALLLAIICVLVPPAHAKLSSSALDDLIRDSDLILQARVIQVASASPDYYTDGSAVLKVARVFKGRYTNETITIRWGGEKHDQPIPTLHEDRLLFLEQWKREDMPELMGSYGEFTTLTDGDYTGTHYGRSYWPLMRAENGEEQLVTPYIYPINVVDVPQELVKEATVFIPDIGERYQLNAVYLDDVLKLIDASP